MTPSTERRLSFETAEGVTFSYQLASPLLRGLAMALDLAIVTAASSMVNGLLAALSLISRDLFGFASILGGFLLSFGYWIYFELKWKGSTPGKKILSLRVIDVEGRRLGLHQVVLRNLLRVVDQLPILYLVGGTTATLNRQWRRVGDLVAGTVVVREPEIGTLRLQAKTGDEGHGHNSLLEQPHLAKRLRQALAPADYRLARSALARRSELAPAARLEVFSSLAERIRHLGQIPPEAVEGVADEMLVRNVVEIIENG
jgi:uncharacterized RDD family membrane protein YckC